MTQEQHDEQQQHEQGVAPPTPTSMAAEVVRPQRYATDRASLERDSDVEFLIAGGPGGQHRNKAETGVRLTHRPTGIVVTAVERRSQHANREAAFERIAERIQQRQRVQRPRKATRPTVASRTRRLESKRRTSLTKRQRSSPME
jgi:protein subunit release factor B